MRVKIRSIYEYLDSIAPFDTALSYDNCGVLVGSMETEVTRALVCLDVTTAVAEEAAECGAELIISHHPVIFHGLKRIPGDGLIERLVRNHLTVLSAHTNLDIAQYGVNYQLAKACGLCLDTLSRIPAEKERQTDGFGLMGELMEPIMPEQFAGFIKAALSAGSIKYTDGKKEIRTVAVSCGAGSFLLGEAMRAGADALVTAEVKHHELIEAFEKGFTILDAGHYETEQVILTPLAEELAVQFPTVSFYTTGESPVCYQ